MGCACGAVCETCSYQGKECIGGDCDAQQGKPFWVKLVGMEVCPIYQCVHDHQFVNCAPCEQLPCKLWQEMKDPSWTDEQHKKSIEERLVRLHNAGN